MANESVIQLFEGKNVRVLWDEEQEKYYFSVVDIIQVLTDSSNPTDYLKKMRKRDAELHAFLGTNCPQVQMVTSTGKKRLTLAADIEGIFRLVQSIPSKKAEPLKRWLAEVGSTRIDQMIDPERELGYSVVSPLKASDYITPIENTDNPSLPFEQEKKKNNTNTKNK
ncbi:MAG: Bro-N domain-containing protein [Paludibacteraceae bacterium]|nr:Bro-N domain-containing protein [Paludibacteraceae bacterium]